jgi:hypothetical protein
MLKKLFSKKKDQPSLEEVLAHSVATAQLCSRIDQVTQRAMPLDVTKATNFNSGFIKASVSRAA